MLTPDQISKLPPELRKAAENDKPPKGLTCPTCGRIGFDRKNLLSQENRRVKCYTCGDWSEVEDWLKRSESPLTAALTWGLQVVEERDAAIEIATKQLIERYKKWIGPVGNTDYYKTKAIVMEQEATITTLTRERDHWIAAHEKEELSPCECCAEIARLREHMSACENCAALSHTPEGGGK